MTLRSSLLFTALAACFTLAAQAAPSKVPLSAFVQEPQFSNPRLSPDGKHIAIIVRIAQGDRFIPILTFYSLPDLKVVGQMRFPVFQLPLDYEWVSNTRLAITKGRELGSREAPVSTGEIVATEVDGSKQEYLFGYEMFKFSSRGARYGDDHAHGSIAALPPVLNNHLYIRANPWNDNKSAHTYLYDVDTRTGARKQLADVAESGLRFAMQPDGTPRFAYGSDENHNPRLYRFVDATGNFEKIDPKGFQMAPLRFSPDGGEFIASYSANGEAPSLIRENLASGQRTTIYKDPGAGIGTLMSTSRKVLPFAGLIAVGKPKAVYFNDADEGAKLHKLLAAQFPDDVVHFIDFTEDGKLVLFAVDSDRDPGSYYLFNKSTGKADLLFSAMPDIEPDDMAPRRPFTFKNREGMDLHGYVTMPAHAAGAKVPFVLLPHGGPISADRWYFDRDAQFLASRGYAVVQVNFRGSAGRGANFENAGYRQWGGKIMDDLVDAVKWVSTNGQIDPARGCVYGASFGGYSALMLAAREPTLFKCAVGYAGVYDLKRIFKEDATIRRKSTYNYWVNAIGLDDAELARFSPVTLAEKITVPVLLIHGGNDETAPPVQAKVMREALIKAGRPPEWLFAPNEGHGFYDTRNATEMYQTLEAFLAKNIGK
ncbi:S9 family peptidase [Massilia sp. DWR3-1-1]|uniref:S9 family peptidase n=1 Tax=Massilia sp. DWR3-1-1 TaxID=2804559 RepID=UPI003CE7D727